MLCCVMQAPSSLLDALEQHLAALEGKKGSAANTPTQSARSVLTYLLWFTLLIWSGAVLSQRFNNFLSGIDHAIL